MRRSSLYSALVGSNRVACINLGLAASTGRIIHVLAAGWRATPSWTDAAVEHFNNEQIAAVVPLEVASDDSDRIVATGIEVGRGGRRIMLRPWGDASRVQGFHTDDFPSPSGPTLEAGLEPPDDRQIKFWILSCMRRRVRRC